MRCLTLLLALLCYTVAAQRKSIRILQVKNLNAEHSLPSIQSTQQSFAQFIRQKDNYNACLAGLFLGDAYRKLGNYVIAAHYDSLAVWHANQRPYDILLQQKANNCYIRNFTEDLKIAEADSLLDRNEKLFIQYPSGETCLWYEMKALCCLNTIKIADAIAYSRSAKQIATQINDTLAAMHAQLLIFKYQSLFLKTDDMRLAFEALAYFDSIRHHKYVAQAANIIGFAFETTHNTDKALEYYQKAYTNNLATYSMNDAVQTRMNMADALIGANRLEPAKNILSEALQYYTSKGSIKNIAFATLRLAKIYLSTEKYDSSLLLFKLTDSIGRLLKHKVLTNGSLLYQAILQSKLGNFKERDSLANLVVNKILQHDFKEMLPIARQRLKDGEMGRLPDSVRKHIALSKTKHLDTTQKLDNFNEVDHFNWQTGASNKFDSTFTEKQSSLQLSADNEYKVNSYKDTIRYVKDESIDARQRSSRWEKIVGITALFLLIVAAGLWLQYKNRRRAERDKAQIEELQKEIHHRVTNNLGVINAMVEMAAKASVNQMPMSALKTRIDSIALVHRLLYSGTAATGKIALQPYFESLSTAIAAIFERDNKVKITVDAPVETDSVIAEKLGLIVNELITNSFKYAFAEKEDGTIHLYTRQQQGKLYLTVFDNGSGLPADAKKGQGSKLIKGICHQLKGACNYQNTGGTFFELTVPV